MESFNITREHLDSLSIENCRILSTVINSQDSDFYGAGDSIASQVMENYYQTERNYELDWKTAVY